MSPGNATTTGGAVCEGCGEQGEPGDRFCVGCGAALPATEGPPPAAREASSAGLASKKPNGLSQNETVSTGMTGQSSARVRWWMPKTYQRTTSVETRFSSSAVQARMPWACGSAPAVRSEADCVG